MNINCDALIPALNEAATIAVVIKKIAPFVANVIVVDNGSSDKTAEKARQAGAIVISEPQRGKGLAIQRGFDASEAEYLFLVDGDDTYDLSQVSNHIELVKTEKIDMLIGRRIPKEEGAFPSLHSWGNFMFTKLLDAATDSNHLDVLSGYRIFRKRFYKYLVLDSTGFQVEAELTLAADDLRASCRYEGISYSQRPAGSESKLRTLRDGAKILYFIFIYLLKRHIFVVATLCSAIAFATATALAVPIVITYFETSIVDRFPTLLLVTLLYVLGFGIYLFGLGMHVLIKNFRTLRINGFRQ